MNIKFNFFPYFFFFLILHIREKIESHWSKLFKASAEETEKWGRKSDSPVSSERNKKGKRKKKSSRKYRRLFRFFIIRRRKLEEESKKGKKGTVLQRHAYQQRGLWILLRKPLETSDHAPCKTAPSVFVVQRVCLIVPRWNNSILMSELWRETNTSWRGRKTMRALMPRLKFRRYLNVSTISLFYFLNLYIFYWKIIKLSNWLNSILLWKKL